jgi:hypothetical protein
MILKQKTVSRDPIIALLQSHIDEMNIKMPNI